MKYTHLFETVAEFTSAYNGSDYCEPWVSYIEENERVNYNKTPDPFNGHPYVDLGLPSGTLWATCNVGASSPEEDGDYFAWGEVEPKMPYTWSNYVYGSYVDVSPDYGMTKYNATDGKVELENTDDAAGVNWGGEWHMPTTAQVQELKNQTTSAWTNNWNGTWTHGAVLTSKINGNSIFFPATGYRYDSTLDERGDEFRLWVSSLVYNNSPIYCGGYMGGADIRVGVVLSNGYRCNGYPVRGVITPTS